MDKIIEIKSGFSNIKSMRDNIKTIILRLEHKIKEIQNIHTELINKNNLFTLGLDSLNFQNKLLDIQFNNYTSIFDLIMNRIYRDYYKFYKKVIDYLNNNITDIKVLNCYDKKNFPIYRDLELYKVYDFQHTVDLNYNITRIILELHNYLIERQEEVKNNKIKSENGLNIHNFINDEQHINNTISGNIELFTNYLSIFNKYHEKYLTRYILKIKLMYGQIETDIRLEEDEVISENTSNRKCSVTLSIKENEEIKLLIPDDEKLNDVLLTITEDTETESDESKISDESNESNESPKSIEPEESTKSTSRPRRIVRRDD